MSSTFVQPPHLRSTRDDWCTPPELLARVRAVAPIGLDPCSNRDSQVRAARAISREDTPDGLSADWRALLGQEALAYVNPPYGRQLGRWVQKCADEAARGAEVVLLCPARPGTRWWRAGVLQGRAARVCFLFGRPRFLLGGSEIAGSTFDVAVIYWGAQAERFSSAFAQAGWFAHPSLR